MFLICAIRAETCDRRAFIEVMRSFTEVMRSFIEVMRSFMEVMRSFIEVMRLVVGEPAAGCMCTDENEKIFF